MRVDKSRAEYRKKSASERILLSMFSLNLVSISFAIGVKLDERDMLKRKHRFLLNKHDILDWIMD